MKKVALLALFFSTVLFAEDHKPVRVYADIVGDLFHAGHIQFLKKAKSYGDVLIVGLLSDDAAERYKRRPILTLEERRAVVEACKYVDEVLVDIPLGAPRDWIEKHNIDVVIHGDDYTQEQILDQYSDALEMGIFITVPYTEGISTSAIIKRISSRFPPQP